MTRIDRLHIEAAIASLDALSFLVGGGTAADGLRAHRVALRQALDADPAPRECDPYAPHRGLAAQVPPPLDGNWQAWRERTNELRHEANTQAQQQYDADAPKDPT